MGLLSINDDDDPMNNPSDDGMGAWAGIINPDWKNGPVFTDEQLAAVRNDPDMWALGLGDLTQPFVPYPQDFAGPPVGASIGVNGTGAMMAMTSLPAPGTPNALAASMGGGEGAGSAITGTGTSGSATLVHPSVSDDQLQQQIKADPDDMTLPQIDWSPGQSGNSPAQRSAQTQLDPRYSNFFDTQYPSVLKIAKQLGVDPSLPLGLAAYESGYGDNYAGENNPFGATPHGGSTPGIDYPSVDDAWQSWAKQWRSRVAGVGSDKAAFIAGLSQDNRDVPNTDGRGRYNSEKLDQWTKGVSGTIDGVRKRLPDWN